MKRLVIFLVLAIAGLAPALGQAYYRNITVAEADAMIRDTANVEDLVILDVRTPEEFSKGHIMGAINVDFWSKGFLDSIATHNINRTYLIYCASGVRSAGAMNKMRKLGFVKLNNMKSGLFGWRNAKLPLVTADR